jgi:hypothetical protein
MLGRVRNIIVLFAALAALALVASVALADDANPPARSSQILGMVPPTDARGALGPALGSGKLTYHRGPVEHANTVYAIYWQPSGATMAEGYKLLVNQFFGDVAADSGKTSNVYYSDTQYSDGGGPVTYNSTFGGFVIDKNSFPSNGCNDGVTQTTVCLTDAQLQTEIKRVITAQHWTAGPSTEFFMFTAKNVGSCFGSSCAFSYYCAYHSWTGTGSSVILYANMPYADTVSSACDTGKRPNNSDADATINVTSHEHNETITDEQGNAWYDAAGYENGDKCAWLFGTKLGNTAYGPYNQLINGHTYEVQQEWSNSTNRCVLTGL